MKTAFVFPGQGSQYVGMGRDLYDNLPEARAVFEAANDALGFDLAALCFEGPEEELKKTSVTQPAILTVSIACLELLKKEGITADMAAGHSLGEYSAFVAAGALEFTDAVRLVQKRGTFMQEAVPAGLGGMAAILGLEGEKVKLACEEASSVGIVEVANYNCPGQVVISGETSALQKAMELAKQYGAKKVVPLAVSGPFHSSLMAPAEDRLAAELAKIKISEPLIPVIANVSADYVKTDTDIRNSLVRQISSSVRWDETVRKMAADGADTFVELGPGKVITGLIKKIDSNADAFNIENRETFEKMLVKMKGVI